MRWISPPERILAILADASLEAGWLTLVYLLVQWTLGDDRTHIGITELAIAALAGLLFARSGSQLSPLSYTALGSGLALLVAGIGAVAFAPGSHDISAVLAMHPGGLLAGVAFLRGTVHAEEGAEARLVESLLGIGLLGLAAFWIVVSISGAARSVPFAQPALGASITFVTAGLLALGLARLASLGAEGMNRHTRRRWLGLLLGVTGVALVVSLPLAAILGVPLATAISGVLGPAGMAGIDVLLLLALPFALLAGWLTEVFSGFSGLLGRIFPQQPYPSAAPRVAINVQPSPFGDGSMVGFVLLGILAAAIVAFVIIRMLGRVTVRVAPVEDNEVRTTELPTPRLHLPRFRLPHRRKAPRTAREAYLAVLALLSSSTDAARHAGETPAEHARRLRTTDLSRLAADYQLDAFGRRILNQPEERRALERWRRFKRRS